MIKRLLINYCFRLSSQCASSETHSKDLGKGFSFRQLNVNLVFNLFSTELQCYINFFSQGTIQIMRDKKAWFFLVKVDKNVIKAFYGKVSQLYKYTHVHEEQGCRSGESTRLPPTWPGFESWCQRHYMG